MYMCNNTIIDMILNYVAIDHLVSDEYSADL